MRIDERVGTAIGLFNKEWADIELDIQNAVRKAVDEKTRDAGENAQKHPVQSSTPLKDASFRAHATVARFEKKYGATIGSALAGLVTIAFAREYAAHVDRAIELDQRAKREKGESGLYAAARKALTAMLRQQGLRPTRSGGHEAVIVAAEAQLVPPLGEVLRPFRRLRRARGGGGLRRVGLIEGGTSGRSGGV